MGGSVSVDKYPTVRNEYERLVAAGLSDDDIYKQLGLFVQQMDHQKSPTNAAFVFIKPHANNKQTQDLVSSTLLSKGISILKEGRTVLLSVFLSVCRSFKY